MPNEVQKQVFQAMNVDNEEQFTAKMLANLMEMRATTKSKAQLKKIDQLIARVEARQATYARKA